MLSLDANILFYAADNTAGARHRTAKQIVDDATVVGAALSEQVLFEFFHASTRKNKITATDAGAVVRTLLQNFILILPHNTVVEDAFALISQHQLSIWDARLLAVCDAHGCSHLLSEDMQDGARYGGVTVLNPFRASNAALIWRALSP
ncbi:MAG TPA: PIN domain-containing protein [Rhizomicrobium sp.]